MFVGVQINLGTPLFSADVFQWAGFRNVIATEMAARALGEFSLVIYQATKCCNLKRDFAVMIVS